MLEDPRDGRLADTPSEELKERTTPSPAPEKTDEPVEQHDYINLDEWSPQPSLGFLGENSARILVGSLWLALASLVQFSAGMGGISHSGIHWSVQPILLSISTTALFGLYFLHIEEPAHKHLNRSSYYGKLILIGACFIAIAGNVSPFSIFLSSNKFLGSSMLIVLPLSMFIAQAVIEMSLKFDKRFKLLAIGLVAALIGFGLSQILPAILEIGRSDAEVAYYGTFADNLAGNIAGRDNFTISFFALAVPRAVASFIAAGGFLWVNMRPAELPAEPSDVASETLQNLRLIPANGILFGMAAVMAVDIFRNEASAPATYWLAAAVGMVVLSSSVYLFKKQSRAYDDLLLEEPSEQPLGFLKNHIGNARELIGRRSVQVGLVVVFLLITALGSSIYYVLNPKRQQQRDEATTSTTQSAANRHDINETRTGQDALDNSLDDEGLDSTKRVEKKSTTLHQARRPANSAATKITLTENGLSNLQTLTGALTLEKLKRVFPGYEISFEKEPIGEGFYEKKAILKKNGARALVITPGDGSAIADQIDIHTPDIQTPFGAKSGAEFGVVLSEGWEIDCFSHAEITLGDLVCRDLRENSSRLSFTLEENENDEKECQMGGYICQFQVDSLTDNKIRILHWQ